MAERKYDLLLYNTTKYAHESPKPQPWYKERIQSKFLQAHRSLALDSSQWKLFSSNPDDFRDGIPPTSEDLNQSTNTAKLHLPIIQTPQQKSASSLPTVDSDQGKRKKIRKKDALYSRALPAQQKRREYIDCLEAGLTANPTLLYPHLSEAIPDHLQTRFENLISTEAEKPTATESHEPLDPIQLHPSPPSDPSEASSAPSELLSELDLGGMYNFQSTKSANKGSRPNSTDPSFRSSPELQDSEYSRLTEDLCSWANQLSDSEERLEPSQLRALFSTTLESNKLSTLAPIQVMDLSNIPGELKAALLDVDSKGSQHSRKWMPHSRCRSDPANRTRHKYGEWYVPVDLWKPLKLSEHLDLPSKQELEQSEKEEKILELDREISELHSASLFLKHLHKKASSNHRVHIPTFLEAHSGSPAPSYQ